jgi:predicted XRE-type DNA-binding protein
MKIAEVLRQRNWRQQCAAKVLGLGRPMLSRMLRGQFRGTSEIKMMECLVRRGRAVKTIVGPASSRPSRQVEVQLAA